MDSVPAALLAKSLARTAAAGTATKSLGCSRPSVMSARTLTGLEEFTSSVLPLVSSAVVDKSASTQCHEQAAFFSDLLQEPTLRRETDNTSTLENTTWSRAWSAFERS